ncbi:MAG TPA: hypothetical protein VNT58_05615 [Gaiellaceae bacterium]|nr:hypothetical protein [Gaiellaceae bacterium]
MAAPVNPPRPGTSPLWLERVPARSTVLVAAVLLAAGYVGSILLAVRDGWSALAAAVVALATVAVSVVVLTTAPTLALVFAALAVAVDAAREAGIDSLTAFLALVLGGALVAGGYVRTSVERRDEELEVAAETVAALNRGTRLARALARNADRRWLRAELSRAARHGYVVTLLLVAVDGDGEDPEELEVVSEVVVSMLRASDAAVAEEEGRIGVVLPYTDAVGGRLVAERVRLALAGTGERTVSIGVAEYPVDAADAVALVRVAGRAVARAQSDGGNRTVCVSLPLPSPPAWALTSRAPLAPTPG